jgi:hypothetical protein
MKNGTSKELFERLALAAEQARRNACTGENTDETYRHRLHSEVMSAFATENPVELLSKLAESAGTLLDWIQNLTDQVGEKRLDLAIPRADRDTIQFVIGEVVHVEGRLVSVRVPGPDENASVCVNMAESARLVCATLTHPCDADGREISQ